MLKKLLTRKKKREKFEFEPAPDVEKIIEMLLDKLPLEHIQPDQVRCVRSHGSTARAYARIWGLQRIFQVAFGHKPVYVIEVISKYYDRVDYDKQLKVIIHELLHIPKTFSGALKSHYGPHHEVTDREVEKWFKILGLKW